MQRGGSNRKGGAFERKICKDLSMLVSSGSRNDLFWRSSMSGGRSTVQFKRTGKAIDTQSGDLSAIHELGMEFSNEFSIECKHYKSLQLHMLIVGGKGGAVQFWKQAVEDATRANKTPLLFAKQNHMPLLCGTNRAGARSLLSRPMSTVAAYYPKLDLYLLTWEALARNFNWRPK